MFQTVHLECHQQRSFTLKINAPKSAAAGALPQTPVGELTALPQTP